MGKDIHSLVIPISTCSEAKNRIKSSVEVFAETGKGYFTVGYVQLTARRKDGREFPAELSISPTNLGGKWHAVGVVKEISQRKKAEQLLREAEQRYHALFSQAPIGVLLIDPNDGAFVEFNDFAPRQLGYSRDEFEKLNLVDIENTESQVELLRHLSDLLEQGGGDFESEYLAKDGEIKSVIITARVIQLAGKTFLHWIFHDISEIRSVEKALKKSEAQYRQLIELAQEGVWVVGSDFMTSFVNPRMASMLGYAQSEMLGKSLFEFINPNDVFSAKDFLGEYKGGVYGNFEYSFIRKDGTPIYTSIAASRVTDDLGNDIGTLALVGDITFRKEMETKLEEYSKNLEQLVDQKTRQLKDTQSQLIKSERLAAIGELAGMVGHDLRNPLSGIKNATYYLQKKNLCPSDRSIEMLQIIDKCVNHSNKIINDLLDYSREPSLDREKRSLNELLDESISMVSVPKGVEISLPPDAFVELSVDPEKIKRVFINLLKNAIDAMPNGGKISVDCRKVEDYLEIAFSDTGVGVPDEVMPKLFLPLFTTKPQGMGFGLAICKRIVDAHGGKITIETAKERGTTFRVLLPMKIEPLLEVS